MERPQREAYARASAFYGGLEVSAGLEWPPGEDPAPLSKGLREVIESCLPSEGPVAGITWLVLAIEHVIQECWPDRAYFLEIGNDTDWVQVFQPYGLPRNRP